MELIWYGAASLCLASNEDKLLFDPFLSAELTEAERARLIEVYAKETALLFTHNHFDHVGDAAAIARRGHGHALCYGTNDVVHALERDGIPRENLRRIAAGETFLANGFRISALRAKHVRFGFGELCLVAKNSLLHFGALCALLRRNSKYDGPFGAKEIVLYEVEAEGKRIQILGSLGIDEKTRYAQHADLLVLAYAGTTNLFRKAERILRALAPKRVMPYHFDNAFPPLTHPLRMDLFVKDMRKALPEIEVILPKRGCAVKL